MKNNELRELLIIGLLAAFGYGVFGYFGLGLALIYALTRKQK